MALKDENSASRFNRKDVYTRVTDRIVADLEQGVRTWMKPWSVEHAAGKISRPLHHNGTPYRGMNVLLLWGEAMAKGYAAPIWITVKQALELNAHVRKGEHGSLVVCANSITKTETNDKGEDVEREIPCMRGVHRVQRRVDRRPACALLRQARKPAPLIRAHRERRPFHDGDRRDHPARREPRVLCAPGRDLVQMPPFEAFRDKESYYATS